MLVRNPRIKIFTCNWVWPALVLVVHWFMQTHYRFKSVRVTDKRVRIMNEIISGIKVNKMYAWEYAFKKLVTEVRRYVKHSKMCEYHLHCTQHH